MGNLLKDSGKTSCENGMDSEISILPKCSDINITKTQKIIVITPSSTPTITLTPKLTPVNVINYKVAKSLYFNKKIGDMTLNELIGMIKQLIIGLITFKK